jgi:4-hydroxy-3-polyprenylbenzoate decarboxylase
LDYKKEYMAYKSMMDCALDLERSGQLIRIREEVDPNLEMAEIHRRVYDAQGPALLFERVKGSPFMAISNIYGTFERTEYIFRDTLRKVQKVVELKADMSRLAKDPLRYLGAPFTALTALPMKNLGASPSMYGQTTISKLPQIKSWPMDGGAFITLPQVMTLDPDKPSIMGSNIGMYRIQLSGNEYIQDEEIGMHYQIHRGIGVHHEKYNRNGQPFKASIFVGGPPSHAFSAIMPLPEGLSEVTFAGLLGGRRFRYTQQQGCMISSDADFVITGEIIKFKKKPEGPFGDHLGYYSLEHEFPVMRVEKVYHRKDPLWHFTVVGRPPAEDSSFGYLIHKIVKELTPGEFPGLQELNAVDAAGVHPLLLAIGWERYMPFREQKPEEILTIANRILGSGQTSLAKFLWIAAANDHPALSTKDLPAFFMHMLERVDWTRDLHFQTKTTIDTLDYSGTSWNAGSKVVIAACGQPLRTLGKELPSNLKLPSSFKAASLPLPGVLAISGPQWHAQTQAAAEMEELSHALEAQDLKSYPLIIVCDDADFAAATINNFVWVSFTRANPSHDIYGVQPFTEYKHWGCHGSLIIDARIKPHHAPVLETDKNVTAQVEDRFFAKGKMLEQYG